VNRKLVSAVYDPLIREGILKNYPKNPYVQNGRSLCGRTNGDPRFACIRLEGKVPEKEEYPGNAYDGGQTIGNVLSDFRLGEKTKLPTGKYPVTYYIYAGDDNPDTVDWLPGQFGYRRLSPSRFVLFRYGSIRDDWSVDLLREKEELGLSTRPATLSRPLTPLGAAFHRRPDGEVQAGNPDGLPDGILIVLTEKVLLHCPRLRLQRNLNAENEKDTGLFVIALSLAVTSPSRHQAVVSFAYAPLKKVLDMPPRIREEHVTGLDRTMDGFVLEWLSAGGLNFTHWNGSRVQNRHVRCPSCWFLSPCIARSGREKFFLVPLVRRPRSLQVLLYDIFNRLGVMPQESLDATTDGSRWPFYNSFQDWTVTGFRVFSYSFESGKVKEHDGPVFSQSPPYSCPSYGRVCGPCRWHPSSFFKWT
jgi:hypothetical protein